MSLSVVTVKQLNMYIKSLLEGDSRLAYISIKGEISNFKQHFASGHLYFTLKDEAAALKCVMFRGNAVRVNFPVEEGMSVICTGRVSVFERDGAYQLYVERMEPDGQGDLLLALEKLKARLEAEGLFDVSLKKKLPKFPKKVGVITSETGAAVRDIFSVLSRRFPLCDIVLCPATVQGELAPESLCNALEVMENTDADVVIIGRGGGSIEDLWCFNDEGLVRKIAAFSKPIISAVGHETDFTLCDFVCDLRAPTPSAAAELAVPDMSELAISIEGFRAGIEKRASELITLKQSMLERAMAHGIFSSPEEYICEKRSLLLDRLTEKLMADTQRNLLVKEKLLQTELARLDALSPAKTLLRGFASASLGNRAVSSVEQIREKDRITVRFYDGSAECMVEEIIKE